MIWTGSRDKSEDSLEGPRLQLFHFVCRQTGEETKSERGEGGGREGEDVAMKTAPHDIHVHM